MFMVARHCCGREIMRWVAYGSDEIFGSIDVQFLHQGRTAKLDGPNADIELVGDHRVRLSGARREIHAIFSRARSNSLAQDLLTPLKG